MQRLRCSHYAIHGTVLLMLVVVLFGCRKEQRYPGFTRVGGDGKISYFVDASTIRRTTEAKHFSFVELTENSSAEYDVGEAMVDCDSLESIVGESGHYDRQKHFISNTPQHTQSIASIAHFVCTQGKNSPLFAGTSNNDATMPAVQNLAVKQNAAAEQSARVMEEQKARQIAQAQAEVQAKEEQKAQQIAQAQVEAQAKEQAELRAQVSGIKPDWDKEIARLRAATNFWQNPQLHKMSKEWQQSHGAITTQQDRTISQASANAQDALYSAREDESQCQIWYGKLEASSTLDKNYVNAIRACIPRLYGDLDKLDRIKSRLVQIPGRSPSPVLQ